MSFTILANKETATPGAPILLVQITAIDGDTVYLSSKAAAGQSYVAYGGHNYLCRIQNNVLDAIDSQSKEGYNIPPSIQLTIADGDFSVWSNHFLPHGCKGGTIAVTFVIWDAPSNAYSTDAYSWQFIAGNPAISAKGVITLEGAALSNMTRMKVPNWPRQNRCLNYFPATSAQRLAGLTDPTSDFRYCGYSPDQAGITGWDGTGPVGNLTGGVPYAACGFTSQDCQARGMYSKDSSNRTTGRFTGDTWLPQTGYYGKKYTTGEKVYGFNPPNPALGTSYYPMVWGTQWVPAQVLEPAGEPNSLRAEVIPCVAPNGQCQIQKVVVNGHEIPASGDVLFIWRYLNQGGRNGTLNNDAIYNGTGDPHGNMLAIEVVVPSELAKDSVPSVQVLLSGPPTLIIYPITSAVGTGSNIVITFPGINQKCAGNPPFRIGVKGNSYLSDGFYTLVNWTTGPPGTVSLAQTGTGSGTGGFVYFYSPNTNPVYHLMDLLCQGPWLVGQFDSASWFDAAAYCDTQISYVNKDGATSSHERYRSSFALTDNSRQTLARAVASLMNSANLGLSRNPVTGLLSCYVKRTLADGQPSAIAGSNYNTPITSVTAAGSVANGYIAYRFDGSSIEKDTLVLSSRPIQDTPNRVAIGFQDADNVWQSDTISEVDPDVYAASGNQQVDSPVQLMGIDNFDQGTRIGSILLAEASRGNMRNDAGGTLYPEFTTTVKAAHLVAHVGKICGLTYPQFGITGILQFRLLSVQPMMDGERWKIRGSVHNDAWYTDAYAQNPAPFYRNPFIGQRAGLPYPWHAGAKAPRAGDQMLANLSSFDVTVDLTGYPAMLTLGGVVPCNQPVAVNTPQQPLHGATASTGGSLPPGNYLVAISWNGLAGPVGNIFTAVTVPAGTSTNTITVSGVIWPNAAAPSPSVFIGPSSAAMTQISTWSGSVLDANSNPTTFTITAAAGTGAGLPDSVFQDFIVSQTAIIHGGCWGDVVYSVSVSGATQILTFTSAAWTTNQWAGHILSLYYRPGGAAQVMANLLVISNTATTLTLFHGSTAYDFQAGDVVVMRALSGSITSNTIGDANFVNSYAPGGLAVNAEAGNMVQIIAGMGAWQPPATIASNTSTVLKIKGTWYVTPDSTSVFIIISPSTDNYTTSPITNDGTTAYGQVAKIPAATTRAQSILVQISTVDAQGNGFPARMQPWREIYVPPQVIAGGSLALGYFTITPISGVATIDLANGLAQRVVLDGTVTTIAAPVFTGGAIGPGSFLKLYLDQDATGGRALPSFTGGTGGFVSTTAAQITMDGTLSTRTALVFGYHAPGVWSVENQQTGAALS